MRTVLVVAMLVGAAATAGAQERLADQLRKGIVQEEASQNLDKAIQAYQSIVAQYDEERKTAGTALFRLAECYRKAGKREQAVAAYQRVVREFADQATLVESSRQQLTGTFGVSDSRPVTPRASAGSSREAIQRQLQNAEERMAAYEQRIKAGTVARDSAEYQQLLRDVSEARRQLDRQRVDERPPERSRVVTPEPPGGGSPEQTRIELELLQQRLADARKKVEIGLLAPLDYRALETQYRIAQQRYEEQLKVRQAIEAAAQEERLLTQRMMKSVEAEILLVQERITAMEKRVQTGTIAKDDVELLQLRRDLLGLQRKLDELRAGLKR